MTNRPAYNRARYEVGSVRKALSILCLFTSERAALNVTDVSRLLIVPKSTAHNLLRTLQNFDFVSQDAVTKHYRLGRKLLELGTLYSRGNDLLTCALPHLLRLREKTHETVKLGILANTDVLVVKALESPLVLHTRGDEGRLAPLYCTGIGKALLALLSNEDLRDILAKVGLRSFTPRTVTSLSKLEQEVEQVRSRATPWTGKKTKKVSIALGRPSGIRAANEWPSVWPGQQADSARIGFRNWRPWLWKPRALFLAALGNTAIAEECA